MQKPNNQSASEKSAAESERDRFLARSQVLKRGWTKGLIDRFLGDADELRENPYYRSSSPMKLYKAQRVEKSETLPEFLEAQRNRRGKRQAAQKALQTKKQKTAEYVASVKIEVPMIEKCTLIQKACAHFNSWSQRDRWASENSDPTFLERICVNYLRHCLTEYEGYLRKIAGKVGVGDVYIELKTKVLNAIAEKYEWLADECDRQEQRMWDQETKAI